MAFGKFQVRDSKLFETFADAFLRREADLTAMTCEVSCIFSLNVSSLLFLSLVLSLSSLPPLSLLSIVSFVSSVS